MTLDFARERTASCLGFEHGFAAENYGDAIIIKLLNRNVWNGDLF